MSVQLIAAVGDKGLLGLVKDGVHTLPWRIPEDLKYFSEKTKDATVIMGRNTWDSLPAKFKPLPKRRNIVLSRGVQDISGGEVYGSIEEALAQCGEDPVWIIGGGQVYKEALLVADTLYITRVMEDSVADVPGAEKIFFPNIPNSFDCKEVSDEMKSETGVRYRFEVWERV